MIDTDKAAAALIGARQGNRILDSFPGGSFPADIDEAYAVLDSIAAKMTTPVVGWKAALTNDEVMKKMNATAPACGPLFEPYVANSPMRVTLAAESARGLECEFAFRMAKTWLTSSSIIVLLSHFRPAASSCRLQLHQ